MSQPPVYRSSRYPDPDPEPHPGYRHGYQGSGQPPYPSYEQPYVQPGYQGGQPPYRGHRQAADQSYPGYGQRHSQETTSRQVADRPPPKKSVGSWFGGLSPKSKYRVVLFAIAILAIPFAVYFGLDEPNQAAVGNCMAGQSASDRRIVECGDSSAEWKVLGRLEGKTEADHNDEACSAYPETAASFYQDGRRFSKGFILCLGLVNT
jgi:hypothetical protein